MKITAIEKNKGTRYTVYVDDEYWYILDIEIICLNYLKPGMEVDEDFLDDILVQAEKRKARERAYYLLGYRDHSKKELYDKLRKSAREEVCLEVIKMLEEQFLLDDEKYAVKLAKYYIEQKKWGAKKAYYEMLKKGIDKETALASISEIDVDTIQQIKALIEKKYYNNLDDYKGKQKVIAALMRLGFSYDDIKQAISEYNEN